MARSPRIFISSSLNQLDVAHAVRSNLLMSNADVKLWNNGVFSSNQSTLEEINKYVNEVDFAIFISTTDDFIKPEEPNINKYFHNVFFELGLFIGKLGRERNFIISPYEDNIQLPSNLFRIHTEKYHKDCDDLRSSVEEACNKIIVSIRNIGILKNHLDITKIGFAIPSRTNFNNDLISEIKEELKSFNIEEFKNYSDDLDIQTPEFHKLLDKMLEKATAHAYENKLDCLIIHLPRSSYSSIPSYQSDLLKLIDRKIKLIFIEAEPIFSNTKVDKSNVFTVKLKSVAGANTLCLQIKETKIDLNPGIVLVHGPNTYPNARKRAKVIERHFADVIIDQFFAEDWQSDAGKSVIREFFKNVNHRRNPPRAIICGNDELALGVCDGLTEESLLNSNIKVIGFDGIKRALERIRTPESSFWATFTSGPGGYAKQVRRILEMEISNETEEVFLPTDPLFFYKAHA